MNTASCFFKCAIPHQIGCVSDCRGQVSRVLSADTWLIVCCVSGVISRCFLSSSPNLGKRQGLRTYWFQLRFNEIPVKSPIKKAVHDLNLPRGRQGRERHAGAILVFFLHLKPANLPLNHLITNWKSWIKHPVYSFLANIPMTSAEPRFYPFLDCRPCLLLLLFL